jgi:CRP-like cAMP-binding protein
MERHLDSVHHFLREVMPFRFLNTAEIMNLADSAEITRFSRSDVIRPAGKEGAGLILILEGRLKMGSELRGKDQGALLGPGQFIGEWETLFSLPAALSVTADGDGSLARLEEGRVRDLIRTNGAFSPRRWRRFSATGGEYSPPSSAFAPN